MNYVSAIFLAALFAACAHYSWLPLVGYLLFFKFSQIGRIVRAMDALLAAMLPFGWSGRKTVSNECGNELKQGNPCRFCSVLCAILSYEFTIFGRKFAVLEERHCEKEAD